MKTKKHLTAVVAEDEPIAILIRDILESTSVAGANFGRIYIYSNKGDALESIKIINPAPDLIITDCNFKKRSNNGTNGIHFVRSIRDIDCLKDVPILMITSYYECKKKAIKAGVTTFMDKWGFDLYLPKVVEEILLPGKRLRQAS